MDADFIKVNMVKLFLQDIVNELGYAACPFNTNRASADKDKGQQSLALFRVWFSRSFFKTLKRWLRMRMASCRVFNGNAFRSTSLLPKKFGVEPRAMMR